MLDEAVIDFELGQHGSGRLLWGSLVTSDILQHASDEVGCFPDLLHAVLSQLVHGFPDSPFILHVSGHQYGHRVQNVQRHLPNRPFAIHQQRTQKPQNSGGELTTQINMSFNHILASTLSIKASTASSSSTLPLLELPDIRFTIMFTKCVAYTSSTATGND